MKNLRLRRANSLSKVIWLSCKARVWQKATCPWSPCFQTLDQVGLHSAAYNRSPSIIVGGLFFSCEEDWGLAWLNQEITKDSDSFFSPSSSWVYGFLLYNPASCMYLRIREGSHKEERLSQMSGKHNFSNSQQFSVNMLLSDVIYCKRDWGI